jgi:hypothetical protein
MFIQDGTGPGGRGRKRLGELLLELDLITPVQLEEVLAAQKTDKRRLGTLLVEKKLITSTKLTQVLSYQFNLPFVSLAQVRYTPELVARIPGAFAKQRRVVPICVSGGEVLFAATDDPADQGLPQDLGEQCGMEIRLMVASPDEVQVVLDSHYQQFPSRRPPQLPRSGPTGAVRVAVSDRPPKSGNPAELAELSGAELELIEAQGEENLPVALCVGANPAFVSLCIQAAKAQGLRVQHASPVEAVRRATELRPVALVVLEDVFAGYRLMLTELSIDCGAHLVIWSDHLDSHYLEGLFAAVAGQASRARS